MPLVPSLTTANPTQADLDLYAVLQRADGGDPDALPSLLNGNLWIGNAPNQNYPQGGILGQSLYDAYVTGQLTDPGLLDFAKQSLGNANLRDSFSLIGDNLFPVLALFGAAAGSAALLGAGAAAGGAGAGAGGALAGSAGGAAAAEAATLAAGGALGASGLTAAIPAAGTVAGAVGAGTAATLGATGAASLAGLGGSLLSYTDAGEPITSPVPEGEGVLSTGAATPAQIANAGGSGSGLFGSGLTLADLSKAAGPLISGIGSIVGGVNQGNAVKDATTAQIDATRQSNQLLLDIYAQNRADLGPYREAGYKALQNLQGIAGTAQPTFQPQAPVDPRQHAFVPPTVTDDPGYQFRLAEGQKALERNLAAQGKYLSGQATKAITRYGQDTASQEYQNAYQRSLAQNQLGYERAVGQNTDQYGRDLTTYNANVANRVRSFNEQGALVDTGRGATSTTAQLASGAGTQVAEGLQGIGNARAAGSIGTANAVNAGIAGVGNASQQYLNYLLLENLSKR